MQANLKSLMLGLIILAICPRLRAMESPALLTYVVGDVKIFTEPKDKADQTGGQVLYEGKYYSSKTPKLGMKLFSGAVIHTGSSGKARIVYGNGDQVNVGPASSLIINRDEKGNTKKTSIDMFYGKIRAVVTKRDGKEPTEFKVKSPTSVAGVRGTDFVVGYNPSNNVGEVSVVRGKVAVASLDEKISQEIKPGQTLEVNLPPPPPKGEVVSEETKKKAEAALAKAFEVKPTSQESLKEIKQLVAVVDMKQLQGVSEEQKAEIQKLEETAVTKTIETLKAEDPKLAEKLLSSPTKDIKDLDSAVIGDLMKDAPIAKPDVKKLKDSVQKVGDEIYQKAKGDKK